MPRHRDASRPSLSTPDPSRPRQIGAHHLRKVAVVYVRVASAIATTNHTNGVITMPDSMVTLLDTTLNTVLNAVLNAATMPMDGQPALLALPLQWGWPVSHLRLIGDLGHSGVAPQAQPGFQQLLSWLERRHVGLVVVHDLSRLSPDLVDLGRIRATIRRAGALLACHGQILDPATDLAGLFAQRLESLLCGYEQQHRARLARAAGGAEERRCRRPRPRPGDGPVWATSVMPRTLAALDLRERPKREPDARRRRTDNPAGDTTDDGAKTPDGEEKP